MRLCTLFCWEKLRTQERAVQCSTNQTLFFCSTCCFQPRKHIFLVHLDKTKTPQNQMIRGVFRTEGRDRTGTSVTSSVFETDASTDSATSASLKLRLQKYKKIRFCKFFTRNFSFCRFFPKKKQFYARLTAKKPIFAAANTKLRHVRKICINFCRQSHPRTG